MYYIYHIPDIKIGCTTEPERRVKRQGYKDYHILEVHSDIDVASKREQELQKEYGYQIDYVPYSQTDKVRRNGYMKGGNNGLRKTVLQYDLQGNFIKSYNGARETMRQTGIDVRPCCRGLKKTAGGFIWKYKN